MNNDMFFIESEIIIKRNVKYLRNDVYPPPPLPISLWITWFCQHRATLNVKNPTPQTLHKTRPNSTTQPLLLWSRQLTYISKRRLSRSDNTMATITNMIILTVVLVAICGMQIIDAKSVKGMSSVLLQVSYG